MSAALQWIVNAEPPASSGPSRPFDVGQLPSSVSQAIWRGTEVGQASQTVVSTGFESLDAQLPGRGWPCNAVTELLQPQPSLCEWRLLSPALAGLSASGGQVLLVGPPKRPHVPGLIKLGIQETNLVWIAADTPAERLWTTEQLVKANPRGGAILAWLPQARADQIRRLQVHAQSCDCPVFLFRPEAAQFDASPAPLRVLVTLGIDWQLQVHILKRKGALMDGVIAIPSIPGTLASVFTPRLMHPSQLMVKTENANVHALGRAVTQPRLRQLAAH
jgi:protein ImuA